MKVKILGSVLVMGLALVVSTASANPGASKRKATDTATPKVDKPKGHCDKPCTCGKDGGYEHAKDKGGCGKHAAGEHAKHEGGCNKPCASGKDGGCGHAKDKGGCSKPCASGKDGGCGHSKDTAGGCPIAQKVKAVLASVPSMKFRVGDEVTGCSKSAQAMAEKAGKPVEFIVGEEVLTDKGEAAGRLVALLEKEAESLQKMRFVAGSETFCCQQSAQRAAKSSNTTLGYRVGGFDFAKEEEARKAFKAIHDAVASLKMSDMVGDAKDCCQKSANVMFSNAKIRTIVKTAAAAYKSSSS